MAYTYEDLQNEVKRRGVRDQSGTQYDTAIKNILNTSLFRLAREAPWKGLRRKSTVATEGNYTTGSVQATNGTKSLTFTTSTLITQGIDIGQRIQLEGSTQRYVIQTITSETAATVNLNYDGTSASGLDFTIYGKEEYNLPIECDRVGLVWHEDFGYPYMLNYIPDSDFYGSSVSIETGNTPTHYRMWGENTVLDQPRSASVIRIASSSSADTSKTVTVFGIVSSYPDYEDITTNGSDGTTAVSGSKSFTTVERIVKGASTTGRITVDANSANTTIAVLPVGDTTGTIQYKKMQIWPLPQRVFNLNVQFYKMPYRLVNTNDIHELGQEFDEALICLSVSKIKAENSQGEAKFWFDLYADELRTLRRVNADKLDWVPALKRPREDRSGHGLFTNGLTYQQLGGNYGPVTYTR